MADTTNYGVSLELETVTPTVYATIGEVVNLDFPELANEPVESTHHGSGGWRTFISGGLKEVTEFTATVNHVPANTDVQIAEALAATFKNYQIVFTNGEIWQFSAKVSKVKPSASDSQNPEVAKMEITFKPSGASTFVPAE